MTGFGVRGRRVRRSVNKATVLRIELAMPPPAPPRSTGQTVIGSGFGERADKDVFVIGPTGLSLGRDGTLYVSDAIGNRIAAIADAPTRTRQRRDGREVTKDGFLKRPLAMIDGAERPPASPTASMARWSRSIRRPASSCMPVDRPEQGAAPARQRRSVRHLP